MRVVSWEPMGFGPLQLSQLAGVSSGRKTCIVDRATKFTPSIHASKTTCDGVTTGPSGQVIALSDLII